MDYADASERVRHDLGKYVSFATRFLAEDAGVEALREALRDDLVHTRRSPDGVENAPMLWARLRVPLTDPAVPPEIRAFVARLDDAVGGIAVAIPHLDTDDEPTLRQLAAHAAEVTTLTRALAAAARNTQDAASSAEGR